MNDGYVEVYTLGHVTDSGRYLVDAALRDNEDAVLRVVAVSNVKGYCLEHDVLVGPIPSCSAVFMAWDATIDVGGTRRAIPG